MDSMQMGQGEIPANPTLADPLQSGIQYKRYSQMFDDMDEHYSCLLGTLPSIIYTLDEKGHFTFLSDRIEQLGYTRNDLLGKHFSFIMRSHDAHAVSRQDVLPSFAGKITGPQSAPKLFDERRSHPRKTSDLNVRLVPKTDSREKIISCRVNASGQYCKDEAGNDRRFCGTVGVITCITNEEIAPKKAVTTPSKTMSTIPHDFNNILTALYGNIQLLELIVGRKTEEVGEAFSSTIKNLDRATKLVRRLHETLYSKQIKEN